MRWCGMAEIVNLNRFRKAAARAEAKAKADANAALHGRTKAQKALEAAQEAKARTTLEAHRREAAPDQDALPDPNPQA